MTFLPTVLFPAPAVVKVGLRVLAVRADRGKLSDRTVAEVVLAAGMTLAGALAGNVFTLSDLRNPRN